MKKFNKNSIITTVAISLALYFAGPIVTLAATTPSLGAAASYGVLGGTYTNTSAATTVNGDVGFTTGPAQAPLGTHTNYGSGAPTPQARIDAGSALTTLATNSCTENLGAIVDLSTVGTHPTGVYTPGVYCSTGAMSIGTGGITLSGAGTYIFRADGALTSVDNSVVTLSGSDACDVFWTPTAATTLGATTTFKGTIIDNANAITVGAVTGWVGRALSLGAGTVTTGATSTITVPTCTLPATLNVVKHVINNNGGTAAASAWTLALTSSNSGTGTGSGAGSEVGTTYTLQTGKAYSVTESGGPSGYLESASADCSIANAVAGTSYTCTITNDDIAPQLIVNKIVVNDSNASKVIADFPLFLDGSSITSGVTTITSIGLHTVSETVDSGYASTISGNCAANGTITLALGDVKTCTITNDDRIPSVGGGGSVYVPTVVPPLIDVVKIPTPLALPAGPGSITYTYTLSNIGIVPVNDITMVGDTCSPITLISGDTNADAKLDVSETWVYTCSTTLSKTHTNIVTATGWANGISATDIATATVVVGVPIIPPLIHVTKVPNPLALTVVGGMITYTNKVTNPGVVPLSNISLSDDKCGPVNYISGDTNGNSKLDPGETWTYTCQNNLTKTTTNTVIVSGQANGLTARDFAIATVVVAAPGLPNTGVTPDNKNTLWNILILVGIFAALIFFFVRRKQII